MSMLTTTEKDSTRKKGRWQAVLLAGLVLVGSVAVPQAANAVTQSKECGWGSTSCTLQVKTKDHRLLISSSSYGANTQARYTVRSAGGSLLCSGSIKHGGSTKGCYFPSYNGSVKVTISKPAGYTAKVTVRY